MLQNGRSMSQEVRLPSPLLQGNKFDARDYTCISTPAITMLAFWSSVLESHKNNKLQTIISLNMHCYTWEWIISTVIGNAEYKKRDCVNDSVHTETEVDLQCLTWSREYAIHPRVVFFLISPWCLCTVDIS